MFLAFWLADHVAFVVVAAVLLAPVLLFLLGPLSLWLRCVANGAGIGLSDLIGMRLRRIDARLIAACRIATVKEGLDVPLRDLEAHFFAGRDLSQVVQALIAAGRVRLPAELSMASGGTRTGGLERLRGAEGHAVTALRASGTADFDGEPVQVVACGSSLAAGTRVRVIEARGHRVVVEEVPGAP